MLLYSQLIAVKMQSIRRKARKLFHFTCLYIRDFFISPYALPTQKHKEISGKPLACFVAAGTQFFLSLDDRLACTHFSSHYFDLLGSGWVKVSYGMACLGFENIKYPAIEFPSNVSELRKHIIAKQKKTSYNDAIFFWGMVSDNYQPIDWHIDFKSGYRWQENTWYRNIHYGEYAGVDVKVPWELSRMQHLVELGLAYSSNNDVTLLSEYQNQILDWMASNPPRYGVNWVCTMDVAIRIANCLIAYDIFKANGASFSKEFDSVMVMMAIQHCEHIVNNLEWSEVARSNHYLANICGLLVASAYLPSSYLSNSWLLFSIQELEVETLRQFLPDGGHFESSTSYHRLCGEMVAVTSVFASAIPNARLSKLLELKPKAFTIAPGIKKDTTTILRHNLAQTGTVFSPTFFKRLANAKSLTQAVMRPDGTVPIIGDNDSGRFLRCGGWEVAGHVAEVSKLHANLADYKGIPLEHPYLMQSNLSHLQWLAWCSALLGSSTVFEGESAKPIGKIANQLATSILQHEIIFDTPDVRDAVTDQKPFNSLPITQWKTKSIPIFLRNSILVEGESLVDNLNVISFPMSGIYIYQSSRIHFVIRCGNALVDGSGVHGHDDQLSFDMTIDGNLICTDPGSYVYTPSLVMRDQYRAATAHCAPVTKFNELQKSTYTGAFCSPKHPVGICINFSKTSFVGQTTVDGGYVKRTFTFNTNKIDIEDEYYLEAGYAPMQINPFVAVNPQKVSREYGWHDA